MKLFLSTVLLLAFSLGLRAEDKPAAPAYPLTACVVSGEELGSMGDTIHYIHKEEGKPDRVIKLCCKRCVSSFKKNPAKYLKQLDDAAKADKPAAGHSH